MAAADTIDIWDGPQDLASWSSLNGDGFGITPFSMVKTSDGTFWVGEVDQETQYPQVRKIDVHGTVSIIPVVDQTSPVLGSGTIQDLILATDGTNIWCVILSGTTIQLSDTSCLAYPTPAVRTLGAFEVCIAIYATSAPSGSYPVSVEGFYLYAKDAAQSNNTFGIGDNPPTSPPDNIYPISMTGAFTACASAAQPGICHVMWSECGYAGGFNPCDFATLGTESDARYLLRLSYLRLNPANLETQIDLLNVTERWSNASANQQGMPLLPNAVAMTNAQLRNDHGWPVAFIVRCGGYGTLGSTTSADGNSPTDNLVGEAFVRMWDLRAPVENSPVELQNSAAITPPGSEWAILSTRPGSSEDLYIEQQLNAVLYQDPLLSDENVYLVAARYQLDAPTAATVGYEIMSVILRVPCDGSATFDYLDGNQAAGIGAGAHEGVLDLVSEPRNVWWPSLAASEPIWQYDRICAKAWIRDFMAPGETDPLPCRGLDLTGNLLSFVSFNNADSTNHLTQQVIARDYNPCNQGLHVWQTL